MQAALVLPLVLRFCDWMSHRCILGRRWSRRWSHRCFLGRRWSRRWILRQWLLLELLLCLGTLIAVISLGCCAFPDCSDCPLQDPRVIDVDGAFIMIDDTLVSRY